jgi:hypothetical protein
VTAVFEIGYRWRGEQEDSREDADFFYQGVPFAESAAERGDSFSQSR